MTAGPPKPKLLPGQATVPPERILHWSRTDARGRERYPTNTQECVNSEGIYDFFKLLEPLDPVHFGWRRKIGTFLAEKVQGKPIVEGGYVMNDFPMGYEFYDHHKGPPDNPRHDVYLYGPENTIKKVWRFRSVPEFLPHARWLFDVDSDRPCQCKYCSGHKYQSEITATLNVAHILSGTARSKKPRTVAQRPAAQGRKPATPRGPPSPEIFDTTPDHVHSELHTDLRSGKSYRKGEVVWAAVKPAIVSSSGNELIYFWPAVISGRHVKIEQSYSCERSEVHMYDIRYFPHAQNHVLAEADIIPLQAYRVPERLTTSISSFRPPPNSDYETCMENWKAFHVLQQSAYDADCVDVSSPNFHDAIPAYILAVRMSDYITQLYRPDLEWGKDDSPFPAPSPSKSRRASRHASPQPPADQSTSSFAGRRVYQGMWWGTERIWMGDLVRLKPERSDFPIDTQYQRPPAASPFSAGRPGLFMYIELIHSSLLANTTDQDTTQVTGTLWEAVSEQWTEPEYGVTALGQKQSVNPPDPNTDGAVQDGSIPAAPPPQEKPMTLIDFYPLPPPPPRSKWRAILVPGTEITLPVCMIAGRYYPNILKHPIVGLGDSLLDQLLPLEPPPATEFLIPTDGTDNPTISPIALLNPSKSPPPPNPPSGGQVDSAVERILALAGLGRAWFHDLGTKYPSLDRVEMLQHGLKASCEEIWGWFQTPVQEDSQEAAPNTTTA